MCICILILHSALNCNAQYSHCMSCTLWLTHNIVCTPFGLPILWATAHQGLSLLVVLCMLSMLSSRLSSSNGRCLLVRQGSAFSLQLCSKLLGSLLSMGALGRGPGPLRGSLAGGPAFVGGIITRLSNLAAVALQHVCHGGCESSLPAMSAQLLQMCRIHLQLC